MAALNLQEPFPFWQDSNQKQSERAPENPTYMEDHSQACCWWLKGLLCGCLILLRPPLNCCCRAEPPLPAPPSARRTRGASGAAASGTGRCCWAPRPSRLSSCPARSWRGTCGREAGSGTHSRREADEKAVGWGKRVSTWCLQCYKNVQFDSKKIDRWEIAFVLKRNMFTYSDQCDKCAVQYLLKDLV